MYTKKQAILILSTLLGGKRKYDEDDGDEARKRQKEQVRFILGVFRD